MWDRLGKELEHGLVPSIPKHYNYNRNYVPKQFQHILWVPPSHLYLQGYKKFQPLNWVPPFFYRWNFGTPRPLLPMPKRRLAVCGSRRLVGIVVRHGAQRQLGLRLRVRNASGHEPGFLKPNGCASVCVRVCLLVCACVCLCGAVCVCVCVLL